MELCTIERDDSAKFRDRNMDEYLQAIADFSDRGFVKIEDLKVRLADDYRAKNALRRLKRDGLVFPVARAKYAIPQGKDFIRAIAVRDSRIRRALWLQPWLERSKNQRHLPWGLRWDEASFIDLMVERYTELSWRGPILTVPLAEGGDGIGTVYHRTEAFLVDQAEEPEFLMIEGREIRVPAPSEVSRILRVHLDPRIREAGALIDVPEFVRERLSVLTARSSPLLPFPRRGSALPRGPPFRYRIYAPRSWILKDLEFRYLIRSQGE